MTTPLMLWPDRPGLSMLLWAILVILAMYVARTPAHRAIRSTTRVVSHGLRLSARSLAVARAAVSKRNRQVLLAAGQNAAERQLEREFTRVGTVVSRDLGGYPAMHRRLSDQITRIDDDYRKATDSPPTPPEWDETLKLAGSLAEKSPGKMHESVLQSIDQTIGTAHQESMQAWRKDSQERHRLLGRMMPYWRDLSDTLKRVDKTIHGLEARAQDIDEQIGVYTALSNGTDRALRTLSSSSLTQFVIAGLVLTIALLGGFVNFQLIALPMSEMVGGGSHLGSLKTSDVAALVIIMIEVAMGLFLMESLGITRMFPVIHALDDRIRRRMVVITFAILFILAGVEASLAYMRDLLAADHEALTASLAGITVEAPAFRWIPSLGQMVMGFILPFALTFVAIPLESFIHASRTVMGVIGVSILASLSYLCRLLSQGVHHLGSLIIGLYDLIISVPLKLEQMGTSAKSSAKDRLRPPTPKAPMPH